LLKNKSKDDPTRSSIKKEEVEIGKIEIDKVGTDIEVIQIMIEGEEKDQLTNNQKIEDK